jgi:hypothetical protein
MFKDAALARELERTEGTVAASFADARRRVRPAQHSEWREVGGAIAIYAGADSPMTQTFGLGMTEPATPAQLDSLESFFRAHGAPTNHEVSPLAGVATSALLVARGYVPIEHSSVLVRELTVADESAAPSGLRVRIMEEADRTAWIDASVEGWSGDGAIPAEVMRELAELASHNGAMVHVLVESEGRVISTASLGICGRVALLAGASTVPSARGRGAQVAGQAARFAVARQRGCSIAMIVTEPGTTSQRNAERRGFAVAYTRTKWQRAHDLGVVV